MGESFAIPLEHVCAGKSVAKPQGIPRESPMIPQSFPINGPLPDSLQVPAGGASTSASSVSRRAGKLAAAAPGLGSASH